MPKDKVTFMCQECGSTSLKWLGRCPECEEWNTFVEFKQVAAQTSNRWLHDTPPPQELPCLDYPKEERTVLSFNETNRVLGGGIVKGSLILMAGDPGIGKSTLLLQIAASVTDHGHRVLYVSGEESQHQIQLRAQRLDASRKGLYFVQETDVEIILQHLDSLDPSLVIVDSIQALHTSQTTGTSGTITQVRECARLLQQWTKAREIPMFVAGHVTKDGLVAGPRVLEHMVDVVLYLEADPSGSYRILRGVKNRFGSTNDIALFQMTGHGLIEVPNVSAAFVRKRRQLVVGSAVVVNLEGSRPILAEVQALTSPNAFNPPRRTCNGIDLNRLILISAVLSRRAGLALVNQDIIVNVTGGLRISEPAADLGVALAIASSLHDAPLDPRCIYLGEIDLTGEVRPVPQLERRLAEAVSLGFKSALIPDEVDNIQIASINIKTIPVFTIQEAIHHVFPKRRSASFTS
jgi:DNA repair protein RadA/Sms